jgi:hypothetical protein
MGRVVPNQSGDLISRLGANDGEFGLDAMIRAHAAREATAPSMSHGMLAAGSTNTSSPNGAMPLRDRFYAVSNSTMSAPRVDFSTVSAAWHGGTANSRPATARRARLPGKSFSANFEFPLSKMLSFPHMTVSTN